MCILENKKDMRLEKYFQFPNYESINLYAGFINIAYL